MTDAIEPTGLQREAGAAIETFSPGTNVLVVGGGEGEALEYCLDRFVDAGRPATVVSTDVPARSVEGLYESLVGSSPQGLRIIDSTGDSAEWDGTRGAATAVTVADPDLPSTGEAAVEALDQGDKAAERLCLDSLSTLVGNSTVQQAYKLVYLLSDRVRMLGGVAFYTWEGPPEAKTRRILAQALDYTVTLEGSDEPTVRRLTDQEPG